MNIINVNPSGTLRLGNKGEHKATMFKFNWTKAKAENVVYFVFEKLGGNKMYALDSECRLMVVSDMTSDKGIYKGQLVEYQRIADSEEYEMIDKSKVFTCKVLDSLDDGEEVEVIDPTFSLLVPELLQAKEDVIALTDEVQRKLDNGDFNGKDGNDYILTEQDKEDIADITSDKLKPSIETKMQRIVLTLSQVDNVWTLKQGDDVVDFNSLYDLIKDESNYVVVLVGNSKLRPQYVSSSEIHCDGEDRDSQGTLFLRMIMTPSQLRYDTSRMADKSDIPSLDGYVKNTDYATESKYGLVSVPTWSGMNISNGQIYNKTATSAELNSRATTYSIINPRNLDEGVRIAMCDGKGAEWTPQEQANARKRIGEPQFELIEEITLNDPSKLERSAEPNGTPYNFKKIRLLVVATANGSTSSNYISSSLQFSWATYCGSIRMHATTESRTRLDISIQHGYLDWVSGYRDGGNNSSAMDNISIGSFDTCSTPKNVITSISSYSEFPAGTNIKIYGIRA